MKMHSQKSSAISHRQIVLFLLGLTVCYQMVYQVIMLRTMQNEEATADKECAAPGTSGYPSVQSPYCLEVNLFRSWQKEALQLDKAELDELRSRGDDAFQSKPVVNFQANTSKTMHSEATSDQVFEHLPESTDFSETIIETASFLREVGHILPACSIWCHLGDLLETFGFPSDTVASTNHHMDITVERGIPLHPFGKIDQGDDGSGASGVSMMVQLQAKIDELKKNRRLRALQQTEHHAKFLEEFNQLEKQVRESLEQRKATPSPWVNKLVATQKRLENQLQHLDSPRAHAHRQEDFDHLAKKVRESLNRSRDAMSPWAKDLVATQKRLESELQHLNSVQAHARRQLEFDHLEKKVHGSLNRSKSTLSPWAKDLMATQKRLEDKLQHLDSARAHGHHDLLGNVTNSSLHTHLSNVHSESLKLAEKRAAFRREAAEQKANLEAHLAELAAARRVWETELLGPGMHHPMPSPKVQSDASTRSTPTPALRGSLSKSLSWPAVRTWSERQASRRGIATAHLQELRGARWSGMIPKVACITVIPSGQAAKIRLNHFVENFLAQDYEGPKQLVLVYHHMDEEAKQLVNTYADGSYIKGAATFGPVRELPSTMAFRYGAWVSDSDVVARWDFEEFHHPWRLSLQVRALALTSRQASFFRQPTTVDGKKQPSLVASSMLGERRWMHQHWHPLMSTESAMLEDLNAGHVVEVDVLELRRSARPSDALQTANMLPSACFFSSQDAETHEVSQQIAAKLGSEMGGTYRGLLETRVEVEEELAGACAKEVANVHGDDPKNHEQLARLVSAHSDVENHLAALKSLLRHTA